MARVIRFMTGKFDVGKERPNPINPIPGESLLVWLREQAQSRAPLSEPDAEDWGWYSFARGLRDTLLPTFSETSGEPEPQLLPTFPPHNRMMREEDNPFPLDSVSSYDTLYVETSRFLRQMLRDIQIAGGNIQVTNFATPTDIAVLRERLVFNCTGLGARELFGDTALRPARGQLAILLPQPEIHYAYTTRAGYMFPRPDGIILGGTFELDQWQAVPEPDTIARIVASHQRLIANMRCTA